MSPGVRSFMLGFVAGIVACMSFITYYGDLGGDWLIEMGRKMKTVAQSDGGTTRPVASRRTEPRAARRRYDAARVDRIDVFGGRDAGAAASQAKP